MSSKVGAKTKGYIKNLSTGGIMKFLYNPETFEYSRGATYAEIAAPGMSYPDTQYVRGNSRTFSVELFVFDKPYSGWFDSHKGFLEDFLPPEVNSTDYVKPPEMLFCFGNFIRRCVLNNLTVREEEYDSSGGVTMGRFTLELRQVGL